MSKKKEKDLAVEEVNGALSSGPLFQKGSAFPDNPSRAFRLWNFPSPMNYSLYGYSRSRDKTFFFIPQLRICLDAGHCCGRQTEYVFVTHSHSDHAYDLGYMARRSKGSVICCPTESVSYIDNYIRAGISLNACMPLEEELLPAYRLKGVSGGDSFTFHCEKSAEYACRVVQCSHAVPCVGYGFSEVRSKLKEEYKNLPGKDIGQLKRQGVEITERRDKHLFFYMGDTSIEVYERDPWVFDYPVIITECTFISDEPDILFRCKRDGHISWAQLLPYVLEHPEVTFVLIHFSLRYSEQEILQFFESEAMVHPIQNVVVFVGDHIEGKFVPTNKS